VSGELGTQDGLMAVSRRHQPHRTGWTPMAPLPRWRTSCGGFPNGSVLTDDGVLLAVETFGNRVTAVYARALGGADRRTPFACAAPDFHEEARKSARQGRRLAARVCVPGRRSVTTGRGGPAPSSVDIPPKSGRHFNQRLIPINHWLPLTSAPTERK